MVIINSVGSTIQYHPIYPVVGNSIGSTVQYPPYNHENSGEIVSNGFVEGSGSRVEPDQGSEGEEKQANIFQNMFRDNYGRGKYS